VEIELVWEKPLWCWLVSPVSCNIQAVYRACNTGWWNPLFCTSALTVRWIMARDCWQTLSVDATALEIRYALRNGVLCMQELPPPPPFSLILRPSAHHYACELLHNETSRPSTCDSWWTANYLILKTGTLPLFPNISINPAEHKFALCVSFKFNVTWRYPPCSPRQRPFHTTHEMQPVAYGFMSFSLQLHVLTIIFSSVLMLKNVKVGM
jgi:hypothetical protein